MSRSVQIGEFAIGQGAPLALLVGPCVIQEESFMLEHARRLKEIADEHEFPMVFKASFDKANRTSKSSFRGPGVERGLEILSTIKAKLNLPIVTDVHLPEQCEKVGQVADILQIPAFLCRQTDLIIAAAETNRAVNIKKGQFLAADDMSFAVAKASSASGVLVTERGTSFGYRDLVVDMRNLCVMREFAPVIMDGTHAVQRPGSEKGKTGGDRTLVPTLIRAAVAVGVDALFLEVHPTPDEAPSDGPNSLDYQGLVEVLKQAKALDSALREQRK